MNDFELALHQIITHELAVDFYANSIATPENDVWYWQGSDFSSFRECLNVVLAWVTSGETKE